MPREKFVIEPHFRLQEWVAEEKGYFKDEGLDYLFQELIQSTDGSHHYKGGLRGGPCRHLQALRNSVLAGARQPNLEKWFERLWQSV